MITKQELEQLFDFDKETGKFYWKRCDNKPHLLGKEAGGFDVDGYRRVQIKNRSYRTHHLTWLYHTGRLPEKEIDHKDQNKANNVYSNLREVTDSQQRINTGIQRSNKSGFRGVYWLQRRKRWRARVKFEGIVYELGLYTDKEEAAKAYESKARQLFGEYYPSK